MDKIESATPASLVVSNEDQYTNDDPDHVFFLYNVGLKKFVGSGGFWGTSAAMSTTPKYFFIYDNSETDKGKCYNIRCKQRTNNNNSTNPLESHDYLKYYNHDDVTDKYGDRIGNGFYLDRTYNEAYIYSDNQSVNSGGWYFTESETSKHEKGYTLTLKNVYLDKADEKTRNIYLIGGGFDDTHSDPATCYRYDEGSYDKMSVTNPSLKDNSIWRLISLKDYQTLYGQSPASLDAPIDASFLLMDPSFSVNNVEYLKKWETTSGTNIKIGLDRFYLNSIPAAGVNRVNYTFTTPTTNYNKGTYQAYYGKYSCAKLTGQNGQLSQTVAVDKDGWYTFGCNGVSNTGAKLFAYIQTDKDDAIAKENSTVEKAIDTYTYSVTSNGSYTDDDMLAAGKDFMENNAHYNQVMIYVTGASADNPVYLRFGIKTGNGGNGTGTAKAGPMREEGTPSTTGTTIVDDFKMLFAGTSTTPDLVLDEDNEDLTYLTATTDVYTNATLHLRRTFQANMWNTIILPVSLSKEQLQAAFGNQMMLASLYQLTDKSIRFLTVEDNNPDGYMLEACKPYIIKPSNDGPGSTQAYSTKLNTAQGSWTGSYQGKSSTDGTTISVPANHYVIDRVTLDRSALSEDKINTTTWEISISNTPSATNSNSGNKLTCKGTLARTYTTTSSDGSKTTKIIDGRDDLRGDYFFMNGAIYKVPDKPYGLKAFRCWFETGSSTPAKTMTVYINDVEETTTAIEDIFADTQKNDSWWAGVYNMQGQRLRENSNTEGLPHGLYIVNGKKIMVR